ncbi:MAG: DASH family cryptochrome, partial [Cyanobacteria bacterium P01_F01_bin.42]
MAHPIIVWFRNDLRLHDHAPLYKAIKSASHIVPLYCLDPRQFETTPFGFPKTGPFRAQFLLESLADLRQSLKDLNSNLVIRSGCPEDIIPELAQSLGVQTVIFNREVTSEEKHVERALVEKLEATNISCERYWGATLYHPQNLPFSLQEIPEAFTQFRKQVERQSSVDMSLPSPKSMPPLPDVEAGSIPSLEDLGLSQPEPDSRATFEFKGGETAGKARVKDYMWTQDRLKVYKETRNGMLNPNDASRLSAWLSLGCLSPRYIYDEVLRYEDERIENDSTYWLIFELLWRDYFRFVCAKHGDRVFKAAGLRGLNYPWKRDRKLFDLWKNGQTGYPLVDANMQELMATGFMSNRGRQNVASFLTKNLGIDWRMGAEWFESMLIDYDVCSNWGNWNYTA